MTPKTPKGKARKEFTGDGRTNPYASERKRLDEERKKI